MVTHEEYLKAKGIVDEYEKEEFEQGCRETEDEDDCEEEIECMFCGANQFENHMRGCPEDDSIFGELDKYGYA